MKAPKAPSADEILISAREIRFSVVALTVILWFFWLPGWIAGRAWLALAFFAVAIRRGWRDGTGWDTRRAMTEPPRHPDNSKV